jgi:hypothetical protein
VLFARSDSRGDARRVASDPATRCRARIDPCGRRLGLHDVVQFAGRDPRFDPLRQVRLDRALVPGVPVLLGFPHLGHAATAYGRAVREEDEPRLSLLLLHQALGHSVHHLLRHAGHSAVMSTAISLLQSRRDAPTDTDRDTPGQR